MDTRSPVPPLLVAEDFDLTFFRSHSELSGYLEPWFVEVEYRAWDALGRTLELVVVDPPDPPRGGLLKLLRQGAPHIEARLSDAPSAAAEECSSFLREWLQKVGGPEMPRDAPLAELLVQGLIRGDLR